MCKLVDKVLLFIVVFLYKLRYMCVLVYDYDVFLANMSNQIAIKVMKG